MSHVLVAAFTLSAGHTVYAWVAGIEDPEFTVTTPLAWVFHAVGFGVAVLAGRTGRAVHGDVPRRPAAAPHDAHPAMTRPSVPAN